MQNDGAGFRLGRAAGLVQIGSASGPVLDRPAAGAADMARSTAAGLGPVVRLGAVLRGVACRGPGALGRVPWTGSPGAGSPGAAAAAPLRFPGRFFGPGAQIERDTPLLNFFGAYLYSP